MNSKSKAGGAFSFLQDMGNYESRKVGRMEVNGVIVSTAFTSDEGYETALCDANGAHPVERYLTKDEAIAGHGKWIRRAGTIEAVVKLGGLVDDEKIIIKRVVKQ